MRKTILVGMILLTGAACGRMAEVQTQAGPRMTAAAPPATADHIPMGTMMQVQLTSPLGTAASAVGDRFTATVAAPIVAQNGVTVVPVGTQIQGSVTGAHRSATPGEPAVIRLHFDGITLGGQTHPFAANVLETDVQVADGDGTTLEHAAVGAIGGAVLGAVLGGGDLRRIAAGAAIGAGAGTVISLGTQRADASLPAGTRMTLQTTQHVNLR